MLSPTTKRNILRIIPFSVIWLVFSIVYTMLEKGILGNFPYYPSTGNAYSYARNIFVTPLSALITGTFIGTLEILYFNKWFMQKSFSKKILYKSLIYLAFILIFLVITVIASSGAQNFLFGEQGWKNVSVFFSSYSFLSVVLYMAAIVIVSQFYNEVSENIGLGVLNNFFTGKYHKPTEEERIYMFLDMQSSTTIAEGLGHVKYFEMLRDYYADLTDPVIKYSGEIYQYVGDEMVVSWKLRNGLQSNNCIECFFAMKEAIEKQTSKYNEKFGLVPSFKAAFHVGKVTTGEIGIIKKDIIFTGDVLNTAARILGLCNTYEVDVLASGELVTKLDLHSQFEVRTLGQKALKGKDEKIELFTILPRQKN